MPNIRIMNWHIDSLGWDKARVQGMIDAIGRAVVGQQIDLLILSHVHGTEADQTMNAIASRITVMSEGPETDYKLWCLSHPTTDGHYAFIIRDLNVIRPVQVTAGPAGTNADRLQNLYANTFETWPGTFASLANAYDRGPNAATWRGPNLPLADLYSAPPAPPALPTVANQPTPAVALAVGGNSLGTGHRPPCMAIFEVRAATGTASTIVPIVVCRYTGTETGAASQIAQLKDLHIAQHFNRGSYINMNGAPVAIQELMVAGDFNVDFRGADANGSAAQRLRASAYGTLTPTRPAGGSATPAAAPGTPGPVPGNGAPMAFPFEEAQYPARPVTDTIAALALRAAVTTENTRYKDLTTATPPTDLASMRDSCVDNVFYGGTRLAAAMRVPCIEGDPPPSHTDNTHAGNAGMPVDIANNLRQLGAPDIETSRGRFAVGGMAQHYNEAGTHGVADHPNLMAVYAEQAGEAGALSITDRWVGAKLVSNHLPIVVQLNLP